MWALFLVSLYTAHEIVSGDAPAYWAIGALALAIAHASQDLIPTETACAAVRAVAAPQVHLLLLAGALGAVGGVFLEFAVAYTVTPLLLYWLELAAARNLLLYDLHAPGFVLTRSTSYASLRAASYWVVQQLGGRRAWVRLTPLVASTVETVGMIFWEDAYAFSWPSPRFFRYATLKAAAFAALPLLEEALLA